MPDMAPLPGSLLILFTVMLLAWGAWLAHTQRYRVAMCILLLTGLLLRAYTARDPMLHEWDERYHALVAKHMIEEPLTPRLYQAHALPFDYQNWTANEVWLHKQPFTLWLMALSMGLFGVDTWTARLPSVLLSTLGIGLTYGIGRRLFSREAGLLAAGLHAVNGLAIELAAGRVATDHVDTIFFFLVELSVYLVVRAYTGGARTWLLGAGLACGLAILTKWLPALIVLPLLLILYLPAWPRWRPLLRDGLLVALPAALVALPWQLYTATVFPVEYAWEQAFNWRHFTEGLEGHGQPWWFFLDKIRMNIHEGIYLVLAWFGYRSWRAYQPARGLLLAWAGLPLLIFSLAATKMQGYLLFSFPAYFLMTALFMLHLGKAAIGRRRYVYRFVVGAICLLALRYGFERVRPFASWPERAAARQELRGLTWPRGTLVFNAPCPIELMFYTGATAYAHLPPLPTLATLAQTSPVLIVDRGAPLPAGEDLPPGVKRIRLPATVALCP